LFKGWETRARKSGGYNALKGIVCHHTASATSTVNDTNYMWNNAEFKPVGALYLARDGEVIIGAAGATNCAGAGGPLLTSKGTIDKDTANSNTISIEAANAGNGEPWPQIQQETYVALVAALCSYYELDPWRDVFAHFEWAPNRKIDPAGSSRYAVGGNKWDMKRFRDDVKAKVEGSTPEPEPPPKEDDVTEEDIEKTAQRSAQIVWEKMTNDIVKGEDLSLLNMIRYTRADVNKVLNRLPK
jgi:N-acetylmuramoyl-L-alanine amidase